MRSEFWKADRCLGLAVVVRKACDVAIIQIDQQSIDNIGRSP